MGGKERAMTSDIRIAAPPASSLKIAAARFAAGALIAGLLPAGAMAQDIGDTTSIVVAPQLQRADVAGARTEPGFSAQPIHAGPLVVDASLSIAAGYDTNVLDRSGGGGDAVALLTPRISVRADTARHLLQLTALGHVRRFASTGSEDSEEYQLRGLTRIDLAEQQSIFANGSFGREIESRSSVGTVVTADEPVSFDLSTAQLGADLHFGRLWVRPSAQFETSDYKSLSVQGAATDLSFRNTRRVGGDLAVGYEFSELFAAFGEVGYSGNESLDPAPNAARDASDMTVMAGVRGEVSPLVWAEFAVGYRQRDYDLARFADFSGLTYRADVQWFVTPLMTLRFEASQSFLNSGNAQVAGILSNRASVTGYFDPLRNLRLSLNLAYEHNEYRDTDTIARRPSMRMQAQYLVNRHISLGVFAGVRQQDVSGTPLVSSYTSFSTGLGVTLTP